MKVDVKYHEVNWSLDKLQRFWDFLARDEVAQNIYFGKLWGKTVLQYVRRITTLSGKIVDCGCGTGYLLQELLEAGFTACGIDNSEKSINETKLRCQNYKNFIGAEIADLQQMPFQDREVGCIFLMEVLEHLDEFYADCVLKEFKRVIKPGGKVIITVPNHENLDMHKVACPECGCVFHRMQHMKFFEEGSLRSLMQKHGFEIIHCEQVNFSFEKNLIRRILFGGYLSMMKMRNISVNKPNLICIAAV